MVFVCGHVSQSVSQLASQIVFLLYREVADRPECLGVRVDLLLS